MADLGETSNQSFFAVVPFAQVRLSGLLRAILFIPTDTD
jgi:hypothetical protein